MPDATEWLVEYRVDGERTFDHFDSLEEATMFLRANIERGYREALLYHLVPFTTRVDVTVKARRTRKQKASLAPAEPSGGPPLSGSEPPSAGGTKAGAADLARGETTPARDSASLTQATVERTAGTDPASPVLLIPTGKEEESPKEGADRRPAPSPVCEASWPGDPACPGPAVLDVATGGRFCGFHLVQVPESFRYEMHRIHGSRNRPAVRLAG